MEKQIHIAIAKNAKIGSKVEWVLEASDGLLWYQGEVTKLEGDMKKPTVYVTVKQSNNRSRLSNMERFDGSGYRDRQVVACFVDRKKVL